MPSAIRSLSSLVELVSGLRSSLAFGKYLSASGSMVHMRRIVGFLVAALLVLSVGTAAEAQAPAKPSTSTDASADRTWISFTLVTSVLVGEFRGDERLKMDEYVYVPDPLSRGLTMAGVALHPKKYDSTQSSPSAAERFAVLVGGVITPTGGVGIGAAWMAARPVSVNAGLAVLLVNTAKNGKQALDIPTDLVSPLKTGAAYGWFVGANYNLGR
jgi:hypothetical protein